MPIRLPRPFRYVLPSLWGRPGAGRLAWVALLASLGGCVVRVYQPMSGMHQPIVVDPQSPNFEDMNLTVHCLPGEDLSVQENTALCQRVETLFENQGASVRMIDTPGMFEEELEGPGGPSDLTLELRSRIVFKNDSALSWLLCIGSFTILPAIDESMFAQDVTIRDSAGFLLLQDTLKGRVIRKFGAGTFLGNFVVDTVARKKEERITGSEVAKKDLSQDFYGQLSQLLFNAKMRWEVLQEAGPAMRIEVP